MSSLKFYNLLTLFFLLFLNYSALGNNTQYIDNKRWEKSNYVFDLNSLPAITIEITTEEWNKLLIEFDKNPQNEKEVSADFSFEKNNKIETFKNIEFRIRGNMSRRRPEGKKGEMHNNINPKWRHAHFRINFISNENKNSFYTLSSLNLKWFKDDSMYAREIYCYNLFQRFGVYTSPRSSYCKLYIKIKEDFTPVYFGVYEMIEPVDKEFIKTRFNKTKNSDNGNLWKCSWGASLRHMMDIGMEDPDGTGKRVNYDLKTNKKDFEKAKKELTDFITNLNKIDDKRFKNWIKKNFDVELFLKAYAVNVLVGMWDDYWANNGNNYYIYFDENSKCYFIPYDYDNTLGTSLLVGNSGIKNIYHWGNNKMPLINRILSIKEYKDKYSEYIKQLIDKKNDLFDFDKSITRIQKWQEMIAPYIENDTGEDMKFTDIPADWGSCHFYRLLSGNDNGAYPEANYFKTRIKFASEQLIKDTGEEIYPIWLWNSPFVENKNYSVDIVVGLNKPGFISYMVFNENSDTPKIDDFFNKDYSSQNNPGFVLKGSTQDLIKEFTNIQITELEINKSYDIYFIASRKETIQPIQLMQKLTVKTKLPSFISPEITKDKVIFRAHYEGPEPGPFIIGDFTYRINPENNDPENFRMKDENNDKIYELIIDKNFIKDGDTYYLSFDKKNHIKNHFIDAANPEKKYDENKKALSVIKIKE